MASSGKRKRSIIGDPHILNLMGSNGDILGFNLTGKSKVDLGNKEVDLMDMDAIEEGWPIVNVERNGPYLFMFRTFLICLIHTEQ